MVVRLFESLRAVFYTPFYLALELGAWAREGLQIELGRPEHPSRAATSLFDGGTDVTWGGPMRMLEHLERHPEAEVVGFAEAVTRDPFYLVGRVPRPDFRPRDLCGPRLATVSEVPTPWLCLQDDLRRDGVDPDSGAIDRIADRSMAENAAALGRGEVDVVQLFEPYVEALLAEGAGHLWYAAAARGPTSYTTLYTSGAFARARPEVLGKLAAGLYAAQSWLHAHDADRIAAAVRPYFPELEAERLAGAIARYRGNGVWGRDPVLPVVGFVRLKCALLSGGFIARDLPFERCVDNRFARAAIAARGRLRGSRLQ